jgi:hypothetical protein
MCAPGKAGAAEREVQVRLARDVEAVGPRTQTRRGE